MNDDLGFIDLRQVKLLQDGKLTRKPSRFFRIRRWVLRLWIRLKKEWRHCPYYNNEGEKKCRR